MRNEANLAIGECFGAVEFSHGARLAERSQSGSMGKDKPKLAEVGDVRQVFKEP